LGVQLLDLATKKTLATLTAPISSPDFELRSIAFSPDSRLIATAIFMADGSGNIGSIAVWDTLTRKQVALLTSHTGFPDSIAWSPDGSRLACSSFEGMLKTWNTTTWQEAKQFDRLPQDIRTGAGGAHIVCWSPDGSMLASVNVAGWVMLWDAESGRKIRSLSAHSANIRSIAFSPDGSRLATAGIDKCAKIWDVRDGAHLLTLRARDLPVEDVAWSPNGEELLTSAGGEHFIWSARPPTADGGR
jgi:WD40 repeat protein